MKHFLAILLIFSCQLSHISAQSIWQTLSMVTYTSQYDPDMGFEVKMPTVNPLVMSYDNKEIEVEGYIIPLTGKKAQKHFMLSRYPENMCFFCGAAGPETAMQVFMKGDNLMEYTSKKIIVKGILHVSPLDAANLIYTLEEGEFVRIKE